jgi:hypothetical protein
MFTCLSTEPGRSASTICSRKMLASDSVNLGGGMPDPFWTDAVLPLKVGQIFNLPGKRQVSNLPRST